MVRLADTVALALVAIAAVFAAPTPQNRTPDSIPDEQLYFLRTDAPSEPWHNRTLVVLPHSSQIGLENFTIWPETPALKLFPILLDTGNYVLQGEEPDDDEHTGTTPYLAALQPIEAGTRTISLQVVYVSDSTPDAPGEELISDCPEGYTCTIDEWALDAADASGVFMNLRFTGFPGEWEPFKDAGARGWEVYWKGNAGLYHPVKFDLVPFIGTEL